MFDLLLKFMTEDSLTKNGIKECLDTYTSEGLIIPSETSKRAY